LFWLVDEMELLLRWLLNGQPSLFIAFGLFVCFLLFGGAPAAAAAITHQKSKTTNQTPFSIRLGRQWPSILFSFTIQLILKSWMREEKELNGRRDNTDQPLLNFHHSKLKVFHFFKFSPRMICIIHTVIILFNLISSFHKMKRINQMKKKVIFLFCLSWWSGMEWNGWRAAPFAPR